MKTLPGRLFLCLLLLEVGVSKPLNETSTLEEGKAAFERYNKCKVQHIDKKMTMQKCMAVIKQKNIHSNDNVCKATNTFILADPNEVKSICEGEGDNLLKSHLTKSKRQFSVVVCTRTKGAQKLRREYEGKLYRNRFVLVQCSGVPVQYAENILDVEE